MNISWHIKKREERGKALYNSRCCHVRTRDYKWESSEFINNLQEIPITIFGRQWTFEINVQPLEGPRSFYEINLFGAMKLRLTFATYLASSYNSFNFSCRAETKALIGGGGGIFIYSRSARRISFEISCHYSQFQKKFVGRKQIYEYAPPN